MYTIHIYQATHLDLNVSPLLLAILISYRSATYHNAQIRRFDRYPSK